MFNLPKLQGHEVPKNAEDIIFFSCDYDYFDRHGYALAQSIVRTVGWLHVHCHVINEGNINKVVLDDLVKQYPFTYSYEDVFLNGISTLFFKAGLYGTCLSDQASWLCIHLL